MTHTKTAWNPRDVTTAAHGACPIVHAVNPPGTATGVPGTPPGTGCENHADWPRMSGELEAIRYSRYRLLGGNVMSPSFVHGLDTAPLRFETIGQALDASVVKWGANDALIVRHQ